MEKVKNVYQCNNNKKTIKDCLKRLVVSFYIHCELLSCGGEHKYLLIIYEQ